MPVRKTKTELPKTDVNGKPLANVEEEIDAQGNSTKKLSYQMPLDEIKNNDNKNDLENEIEDNSFEFTNDNFSDYQEIPKSNLELMFDELSEIASAGQVFYANVNRLPDSMNDNFFNRCNADSPVNLGRFQFSLRDIFEFTPAIQKLNNNSGGRFSVTVYDANNNIVQISYGYSVRKQYKTVGIANLYVPNPLKLAEETKQVNSNDDKLLAFMQQSDARFFALMEKLGQPKEKSEIEKALETATLNRLINPQENKNDNSAQSIVMEFMKARETMDLFRNEMFKDNTPQPPEKLEWYDKLLAFAETDKGSEIAKGVVTSLSNVPILAAKAFGNRQGNAQPLPPIINNEPITVNPQALPNNEQAQEIDTDEETEEMKLQNEILDELESASELTIDNPVIVKLKNDFPIQFIVAQSTCKNLDFQNVLEFIRQEKPELFDDYVQMTENGLMYNEKGIYVKDRLEIIYNLLKNS